MNRIRLTPTERRFLESTRRIVLVTVDVHGRPRAVPICFTVADEPDGTVVWSPIDEKPKQSGDPRDLARVRDVAERPEVGLLADRWDEDWGRLAWLRLRGAAALVEPDGAPSDRRPLWPGPRAIAGLRARYPQYADHDLESRPLIRIELSESLAWGDLGARRRTRGRRLTARRRPPPATRRRVERPAGGVQMALAGSGSARTTLPG